ncbi:Trx7/PDZ domain-containing (seleno)protein [Rubinisphaera margarita]|uniref:Trx7/PDZ domain-containing (seleno)protein n=1 Tax=Rubinisphaera margarita TaxID=2909586 RepID=UPI001EE83316|nr:Trx7/PDZ domain-containing (seleno)protein [Rubinisphaera margarita]MCG6156553.1 PDZ domain-containing protein [Rubinisphaera margarita]
MLRPLLFCALLCTLTAPVLAQTREEIVRGDKAKVEAEGFWIYNDLPAAFAEAKRTGKPIVVVLRCLPCHECVKLDDELVDTDPVIRPLLEQFVCARQVSTNGLDLNLFQYDTDQSFAVFFLNADKTIYGRFGTRSHRTDWVGDVSLEGLSEALQGALDLHARYGDVKQSLAGKTGQPMEVSSPEKYPSLKDKYTDRLNYSGDVVKSCIHCHQIGDAQRELYWGAGKPIPDKVLWPYPHPKVVGLVMNPDKKSTVRDVDPDSAAARAGIQEGDVIESFNGQPILSIADIQWVLHNIAPQGGSVPVTVKRNGSEKSLTLSVTKDWRRAGDLSWRVTTWGLRRIAAGGMVLETIPDDERQGSRVNSGDMALRVRRVGQHGPHAAAKRAGFREGDLIVAYDGRRNLSTEQDLLTYVATSKKAGDRVRVNVIRNGKPLELTLPIQK